jgi:6-phosphogluconolactonase (cycloisomerase 2 family)
MTITLAMCAVLAGACGGKSFFSGTTSSSSSGGGGGGGNTMRSVYVTNFGDGKLSALAQSSGVPSSPRTIKTGAANGPLGLAVTPTLSALYVANSADNQVHEFALSSTGNLSTLGTIATGTNPQQVLVTTDGAFAYAINSGGSISQYLISSAGALTSNTPASFSGGLFTPISGVLSSSVVYVTDRANGAGVVVAFPINSDGTLGTALSRTLSLGIAGGNPAQITIDTTGAWVFVGDATSGVVSVFQILPSGALAFFSQTSPLGAAAAGLVFAITSAGNAFLFVATPSLSSVTTYSFSAGFLSTLPVTTTGFLSPTGLAVDNASSAADLFVTNAGNGTVSGLSIDPSVGSLTQVGSSATENPANSASSPQFILVNG